MGRGDLRSTMLRALAYFSRSGNGLAEVRVMATANTGLRVRNFMVTATELSRCGFVYILLRNNWEETRENRHVALHRHAE
jgi:hypothetical protein